jgi:hypothetical protein
MFVLSHCPREMGKPRCGMARTSAAGPPLICFIAGAIPAEAAPPSAIFGRWAPRTPTACSFVTTAIWSPHKSGVSTLSRPPRGEYFNFRHKLLTWRRTHSSVPRAQRTPPESRPAGKGSPRYHRPWCPRFENREAWGSLDCDSADGNQRWASPQIPVFHKHLSMEALHVQYLAR